MELDPSQDQTATIPSQVSQPATVPEEQQGGRAPASVASGETDPAAQNSFSLPVDTTQGPEQDPGQEEKHFGPSRFESFLTGVSAKLENGVIGNLYDQYQDKKLSEEQASENATKLTPAEAMAKYPGTVFTTDVYPEIAAIHDSLRRQREAQADWENRNNPSPRFQDFSTGLVAGALDPFNLTAGLVAGATLGVGGALLGAPGFAGSVAGVLSSNLAVNAAGSYLSYAQRKAEGQNVSVGDEIIGAVEGAVGGTALHFGIIKPLGALFKRGIDAVRGLPPDLQAQALKEAIGQNEAGASINTEGIHADAEARAQGHGDSKTYSFPMNAQGERPNFEGLGPGTAMGDNHARTNSQAQTGDGGYVGFKTPGERGQTIPGGYMGFHTPSENTKFMNLDTPARAPENSEFIKAIEKNTGIKIDLSQGDGKETLGDLIRGIGQEAAHLSNYPEDLGTPGQALETGNKLDFTGAEASRFPDILQEIQETAKDRGYARYKYGAEAGGPSEARLLHFDPDLAPDSVMRANPDVVAQGRTYAEKQADIADRYLPENSDLAEPERDQEIRDLGRGDSLAETREDLDPILDEQEQMARQSLSEVNPDISKVLEPGDSDSLEKIKEQEKSDAQSEGVLKKFTGCISGDMA